MDPQGVGARLIRVSDEHQDTERQYNDIAAWERRHGVVSTYSFEDKESRLCAKNRPQFQRLLQLVRDRAVNWVVVQSIDRLGFQHTYEFFKVVADCLEHGVSLYAAVDDKLLSSTDDYTVFTNAVGGQASQKEIAEKSNRSQSKRILKGQRGAFQSGLPPFGFDVVCKDARGETLWRYIHMGRRRGRWLREQHDEMVNRLPPHDRTAGEVLWLTPSVIAERVEVLRRIFAWYDGEAISTLGIARRLNAEGISPILHERWQHSKVKDLLANPAVIGRPASNKVTCAKVYTVEDGAMVARPRDDIAKFRRHALAHWLLPPQPIFDPIVDDDLFWRCCRRVLTQGALRAPKNEHLFLAGLLVCGTCKHKMFGQYKAKTSGGRRVPGFYNYYRCATYMHRRGEPGVLCRNHGTLQESVMPYVEEFLRSRGQILESILTNKGDRVTLAHLFEQYRETDAQVNALVRKMWEYISDAVGGLDVPIPDPTPDNVHYIVDLYDQVFHAQAKEIEGNLAWLEGEHTRVTGQYFKLPELAQAKAIGTLRDLERRIAETRAQLEPLHHEWEDQVQSLHGLKERLFEARTALRVGSLRQKAQALRRAIDRIEVHYVNKGARHSTLVQVVVVPLAGEPQSFAVPNRASRWQAHVPLLWTSLLTLRSQVASP